MNARRTEPPEGGIRSAPALSAARNYPLNCWWVAAAADEVTRTPLSRWLLDRRVVLFRTEAGAAVALEDRCAHRWAPLSQGKLIRDQIACPYHGFRYDSRGRCTLVPTQASVPAALKVQSYPVREQGSYVWIWMGEVAKADPTLLPDIPWLTDPAYLQLRGYMELDCDYMLLQENVLDPTHVAFVHADVQQEGWDASRAQIKGTDRSVTSSVAIIDVPVVPYLAAPMGMKIGTKVNRLDWTRFESPACNLGGMDIEDRAPASGGRVLYVLRNLHCTTPISANRCHYWWAVAQDYGQHLPHFAATVQPVLERAFHQDKVVLEAIQRTIDQDIRGADAPEFLVASDRAVVEARRILKRMLQAESW
jgi:phenylpropionate dioxygenase-like ring-hydroxylating dioxygenase large terminal subunit